MILIDTRIKLSLTVIGIPRANERKEKEGTTV